MKRFRRITAVSYTHLDVYKRQEYLIILDSDCILPEGYLAAVESELQQQKADAFGGPDRAHDSDVYKRQDKKRITLDDVGMNGEELEMDVHEVAKKVKTLFDALGLSLIHIY